MIVLRTEHAGTDLATADPIVDNYTVHLRAARNDAAYAAAESSLHLADDESLLGLVQAIVAQKKTPNLKYVVVVGIGGSNLGAKAVYDALLGYKDVLQPQRFPKMLFAETTDAEWLGQAVQLMGSLEHKDEVLVVVISKSGGTTETVANFEIILQALRAAFDDIRDRVVAITNQGSALWQAAEAKEIACLPIPDQVGGRYSVLSAVGLFPLAMVDIDIVQLRKGAAALLDHCLGTESYAAQSAHVLADQSKNGYRINDNFLFHPELESLGKWYRQLMGESVGKEKAVNGETVHAGTTPTVSLGSTDLHSVGQLYLGGPKDKLTTFVSTAQTQTLAIPNERFFPELAPMISGKTAADIMKAILEGVQIAYQKADLPYMEVVLDAIDEQSLGAFLQFKMLEMMYLGKLLNVNSFDQPNVEAYKIETKRLLET